MNSKVVLSNYLRNFYLIFAADKLRYFFSKYKNLDKNKKFLKKILMSNCHQIISSMNLFI